MDGDEVLAAMELIARGFSPKADCYVIANGEMSTVDWSRPQLAVIQNSDIRSKPGSHWLIYIYIKRKIEFFDTYGECPSFYQLDPPAAIKNTSFSYNTLQVQSENSSVCSQFCLYVLCNRLMGRLLDDIVSHDFSATDFKANENLVTSFYDSLCFSRACLHSKKCQSCQPRNSCK